MTPVIDAPPPPIDAPPGAPDAPPAPVDLDVDADITTNTTWTSDTTYHLKAKAGDQKYILVTNGATLTIEAGTQVLGGDGSALVITRGSKIEAVGTATNPIVFSHDRPVGQREGGKWGGIVVLGAAPINIPGNNEIFEAFPATIGDPGRFGGNNTNDDSGTIKYVRIEFAGFPYAVNREFNALTLCGVGKGTEIDFVQMHRGSDDGIELFGGTVDVKHILSTQNEDDGFDTDNGWNGRAQFIVVQHINGKSSDPNGFESDNNADAQDATYNLTPTTRPTMFNATVIGNKAGTASANFGAVLRRGTSGTYRNIIFTNFGTAAVEIRNAKTVSWYPTELSIESSIFFGNNMTGTGNWSTSQVDFDESASLPTATGNAEVDPMIEDALSATAPNFKLKAASPALTSGVAPPNDGFFDTSATFVGGVGATDWTATGWTAYPQN